MRIDRLATTVCLLTLCPAAAGQEFVLSGGLGAERISPGNGGHMARLAVRDRFWQGPPLGGWTTTGHWELALTALEEDEGPGNDRIVGFGAVALLRLERPGGTGGVRPYLELGVGPNWFTETELDGVDISTHLQFSPIGGFGIRFGEKGRFELGYRVIHFSNAGIEEPNPGLNYHVLHLGLVR